MKDQFVTYEMAKKLKELAILKAIELIQINDPTDSVKEY